MTPAEYVTAIETFLAGNIGIQSIRHPDGRIITLDRAQAMKELQYWKSKASTPTTTTNIFNRTRFGLTGDA